VYKNNESELNIANRRMLRWMTRHIKKDRIMNEIIKQKDRVALILEKW